MPAILFGSISTIADTSELQRHAFNDAFAAHALGWHWDRDDYVSMLGESGGRNRVAAYAESRGQTVDVTAIHESKSALFQQMLGRREVPARPGVIDTLRSAKSEGVKVALVTTTSAENIAALISAMRADLAGVHFDLIVDASDVDRSKPDAAAYAFALDHLGEEADSCVAIEDNADGVAAAVAAGLTCVAFPNENTTSQDFAAAERVVDLLDYAQLRAADRTATHQNGEA